MSGPAQTRLEAGARFVVHHPKTVLGLLAALVAVAALLLPQLETDMSPTNLSAGVGEQDEIDETFRRRFGNPDNVVVVVVEADDVTTPEVLTAIAELEKRLGPKDYSRSVRSIASLPIIEGESSPERALKDFATGRIKVRPAVVSSPATADDSQRVLLALSRAPMARATLISESLGIATVIVRLRDDIDSDPEIAPVIEDIENEVTAVEKQHGVQLALTGLPFLHNWLLQQVDRDQFTLFPGAIVLTLLLLLATFRWLPALILPAAAVGISALFVVSGMALVGEPINIINNVVPILIIIVGISDSIHLLNRYGEQLASGQQRQDAAIAALRSMAVALFLTSLTTAVGFASLAVSKMNILRNFGLTAAAGMMCAYLVTIFLLPTVLALLPVPKRPIADAESGTFERMTSRWVRILVTSGRVPTLAISAVVLAGSVYLAVGLPVRNNHADQFDEDDEVYKTVRKLDDLTGVQAIEIMIASSSDSALLEASNLDKLDDVAEWAKTKPGVSAVIGYTALLDTIWQQFDHHVADKLSTAPLPQLVALGEASGDEVRRFLTSDHRATRVTVYLHDIGGPAVIALADELQLRFASTLAEVPDLEVTLSGEGYVSSRGLSVVTTDLFTSLLLASVVIFAFLTLMFRSLRMGLLSLPSNILPLATTMAYMRLRGIPLSPATVIIFSISIGLAVDGTIHVLARFREELAAGRDKDVALAAAAAGSGKAVLLSYLSLILGFLVLQLSGLLPIRLFGELISVTVAGCLLATLIVLPPIVATVWPDKRTRI